MDTAAPLAADSKQAAEIIRALAAEHDLVAVVIDRWQVESDLGGRGRMRVLTQRGRYDVLDEYVDAFAEHVWSAQFRTGLARRLREVGEAAIQEATDRCIDVLFETDAEERYLVSVVAGDLTLQTTLPTLLAAHAWGTGAMGKTIATLLSKPHVHALSGDTAGIATTPVSRFTIVASVQGGPMVLTPKLSTA